jgi:predicted nucleic acid-binding protein
MKYLLDTNVVSEMRKGARADAGVRSWVGSLGGDQVFLSALVVGELRRGVENLGRRDAEGARALGHWLSSIVERYGDRILPVDRAVAEEWGRMNVPDPLPVVDGLLAATAKVNGLTLATRNTGDVAASGVPVVNPFESVRG